MTLTKDQILAADDLERGKVNVPEWAPPGTNAADACVYVRTLACDERAKFQKWLREHPDHTNAEIGPVLTALCAADEQGNRLFTNEDATALAAKSWRAVEAVATAAWKVNLLGQAEVEEIAKNSETTGSGSSTSSLPVT